MPNAYIKQATINDLNSLIQFGYKLYLIEKQFEHNLIFSKKKAKKNYSQQIQKPNTLFLISYLNKKPVGYLYAHIDKLDYLSKNKKECEIEVIYLETKIRGTGLAQKMIQECLTWAKTKKCFRIKAGIYTKNIISQKLFSKVEFQPYHTTYLLKTNKK
jgi:RimJ/RimL family protein N-acetyltransferase